MHIDANLLHKLDNMASASGTTPEPDQDVLPRLPDAPLCSGFGQYHTDEPGKENRKPYAPITLREIFELAADPPSIEKPKSRWVIPSAMLCRTHDKQYEHGTFHALWADFDEQPPPLADVMAAWQRISKGDYVALAYTSKSARADYQKSRLIIPLGEPLSGEQWQLAQRVLNDRLQGAGITPDRKTEGCGQLCYLPNRGAFYEHAIAGAQLFTPSGMFKSDMGLKRAEQHVQACEQQKKIEAASAKRELRRAELAAGAECSPIEWFNAHHAIADVLLAAGYEQQHGTENYRHPGSESGSFSARIWTDGEKETVSTLSPRDVLYGDEGKAVDAYGAYVLLKHGGDEQAALEAVKHDKTLGEFVDLVTEIVIVGDEADVSGDGESHGAIEGEPLGDNYTAASGEDDETEPPTIKPFAGVMASMVQAINESSHKPQPMLAIGSVLGAMAAGCPGVFHLPDGGRLNLYTLGIGASGCGKDHPRAASELLAKAAGAHVMGAPGSGEGLEDALPNLGRPTQGVLMSLDEAAHWFGVTEDLRAAPHLVKISKMMLELFSRGRTVFFGRHLAGRPAKEYPHPTVNLVATGVPSSLGRVLSPRSIESGLMGRLLCVRGADRAKSQDVVCNFTLPKDVENRAHALKMAANAGQDVEIQWADDARRQAHQMRETFESAACGDIEYVLQTRSYERLTRIAGVLAVWDDPQAPCIEMAHVQWAHEFVLLSNNVLLAFMAQHMHADDVQANAAQILDTAKKVLRGKISSERYTEQQAIEKRLVPCSLILRWRRICRRDFDEAVNHLEACGDIERVTFEREGVRKKMAAVKVTA